MPAPEKKVCFITVRAFNCYAVFSSPKDVRIGVQKIKQISIIHIDLIITYKADESSASFTFVPVRQSLCRAEDITSLTLTRFCLKKGQPE